MASTSVFVVQEGENPSSSFFVLPALRSMGLQIRCFGFDDDPAPVKGGRVVFVRYIPSKWRRWVDRNEKILGGIIFFMDDDLLDFGASQSLPWRYRYKIWRYSSSNSAWLAARHATLWVSSVYLQDKYSHWPAKLVLPSDCPAHVVDTAGVRVFYHGSASHKAEIRWLKLVIQAVLENDKNVRFELIGGSKTYREWRGVPGVSVVNPMKWPAYYSFSQLEGRAIGLAPLLEGNFNCARSYTKFFDINRSGAVGVFSSHSVFLGVVRNGVDGLVVDNKVDLWRDAILLLARDERLRAGMYASASRRIAMLNSKAKASYDTLEK